MNGNQNYSYYNPYQAYIKKKVNPKKGVSTFQQPYPYTELSDSNTISNISALNNNNTSSNFLDLTDTIEIKGLSDVKSKREKEKLSKQSEDKSGQRTNGRNRFYDKNELLNANGSNEYLLKRNQNNNPPQNIISKNMGTFSFKNLFNSNKEKNHNKSASMDNNINVSDFPNEEVKYDFLNNGNNKCIVCNVTKVVSENVDELTPIPKRRSSKKVPYGEYDYDYNQAKSAAILIRRLEYSYNLRICKQYKRYESQIIFIQRFWRNYMERQNQMLLSKLIENETKKIRKENASAMFLRTVAKVYYRKRAKMAFKRLKKKFAVLARSHYLGRYVNKIINAYRQYKNRKNKKIKRKLKIMLNFTRKKFYYHRVYLSALEFIKAMKLFLKLQQYIKNFLFRTSEHYRLLLGRQVHPNLYYMMKYRQIKIARDKKIKNFKDYIRKWKDFIRYKKDDRILKFMKIMNSVFYRVSFTILLTQVAKKTNALLTFYLLKPRIKSLSSIYFRYFIGEQFQIWKNNTFLLRKIDILGVNLVKKVFKLYWLKPVLRKLKKRKYMKNLLDTMSLVYNRRVLMNLRECFNLLFLTSKVVIENKIILKSSHIKHFSIGKQRQIITTYFNKWRNDYQRSRVIEGINYISKKKNLHSIIKSKRQQNINQLMKYFYMWRKQIYILLNYQTKTSFFIHILTHQIRHYVNKEVLNVLLNQENELSRKICLKIACDNKDERYLKQLQYFFIKWYTISRKENLKNAAKTIGIYCKKKVKMNKKKNQLKAMKKVVNNKNSKLITHLNRGFTKFFINTKMYLNNTNYKSKYLSYLLQNLSSNQTQDEYNYYVMLDRFDYWRKIKLYEHFKEIIFSPTLVSQKPKNSEQMKYLYLIKWVRKVKQIKIEEKVPIIQRRVRMWLKRKEGLSLSNTQGTFYTSQVIPSMKESNQQDLLIDSIKA